MDRALLWPRCPDCPFMACSSDGAAFWTPSFIVSPLSGCVTAALDRRPFNVHPLSRFSFWIIAAASPPNPRLRTNSVHAPPLLCPLLHWSYRFAPNRLCLPPPCSFAVDALLFCPPSLPVYSLLLQQWSRRDCSVTYLAAARSWVGSAMWAATKLPHRPEPQRAVRDWLRRAGGGHNPADCSSASDKSISDKQKLHLWHNVHHYWKKKKRNNQTRLVFYCLGG